MAITIHDVARQSGVSISTVSKVIHGSARISQPTADRVRAVMAELKFQPNSIARAFAQQTSGTIGVLMDMHRNSVAESPHAYQVLGGIEVVLQESGYLLSLSHISRTEEIQTSIDLMVRAKRIDAFILHSSFLSSQIIRFLQDGNIPHVVIGKNDEVAAGHWVDVDNFSAGEMAACHLLDIGRKRPVFIGGNPDDGIGYRRLEGIRSCFFKRGLTLDRELLIPGAVDYPSGYQAMTKALAVPPELRPDAVICSSNFVAAGALRAAKDCGMSIPRDIAFIGFDNFPLAPFLDPPLSIVHMDMYNLGVLAARAIINQVKKDSEPLELEMLRPELFVRGSTVKH